MHHRDSECPDRPGEYTAARVLTGVGPFVNPQRRPSRRRRGQDGSGCCRSLVDGGWPLLGVPTFHFQVSLWGLGTREEMVQPPTSPNLIELTFWTPRDGICDPAVDVGFMPAGPVGADFELNRERALSDLAVDSGPGQPSPGKNGFQADDTVWFSRGRAASCSLFLTASETRQDSRFRRARAFYTSPYYGVQAAENRMGHIPMPRPLPRSMPWVKANSWPSRRPDSNVTPRSILR